VFPVGINDPWPALSLGQKQASNAISSSPREKNSKLIIEEQCENSPQKRAKDNPPKAAKKGTEKGAKSGQCDEKGYICDPKYETPAFNQCRGVFEKCKKSNSKILRNGKIHPKSHRNVSRIDKKPNPVLLTPFLQRAT
jgi:hypothetical protein